MKRFNNDTLEQAINLLLDKSERMQPVRKLPTPTRNGVIIAIQIATVISALLTVWYMAMHPNL